MRRSWIVCAALLLGATSAYAKAGIGIGGFGGLSKGIFQDDAEELGSTFGARVPVHLVSVFTVEPYFVTATQQDTKFTFSGTTYTRSGFETTGFGANLALANLVGGSPFKFYPYGGIGSYTLKRGLDPDITETTYTGGLGLTYIMRNGVGVHLRAEGAMVSQGDASRKFGYTTLGVSYALSGE